MLTNVSSADYLITDESIHQKEKLHGIDKKAEQVNIYAKNSELSDSLEISEKALELFNKEKDIKKFTSLALDSPLTGEEYAKIMELIQEGEFIDNKDLAEALQGDVDLMRYLFS